MKWLKYIIWISFILLYKPVFAQTENQFQGITFYLVRHAEKDTGNNPALKPAGYARAGDLYRALKDTRIDRIYVSQYRRTELTADSLRIYKKIGLVHYNAGDNADDLFRQITVQAVKQDTVLIIGHSNTIPGIIRRLGVKNFNLVEIPDNEYDNLYVVTVEKNKASLKIIKYGKVSPPAEKAAMKALQ